MQEFVALALGHFVHGDARPAGYDVGDIAGGDFIVGKAAFFGQGGEFFFGLFQFGFLGLKLAIADFGHGLVIAVSLGAFCFEFEAFDFFAVVLYAVHDGFFIAPGGHKGVAFFFGIGELFVEDGHHFVVFLPFDGFPFDFELAHLAFPLVNGFWEGVEFEAQAGGGLVYQVDGFVGQLPVGDIAVGEFGGGDERLVHDFDFVIDFVALLQAAQDGDGVLHARFLDEDGLEAAHQCFVFFEVLLVFVEGGGADGA